MTTPPSFSNPRLVASLLPAVPLLLLAGCASTYHVKVQSEPPDRLNNALHYTLQCADTQPLHAEFCQEAQLNLAADLSEIGMLQAPSPEQADIILTFHFDIEERIEEEHRYRGVAPKLKTNLGHLTEPAPGRQPGEQRYVLRNEHGKQALGEVARHLKVVAYEKRLILAAWDAARLASGDQSEASRLWQAQASITDASPALLPVLPYLSNAAVRQMGSQDAANEVSWAKYESQYGTPDPYALIITTLE